MRFRPVPAFVAALVAATLALAPTAVARPAQQTDGECAHPPELGQQGASQGEGEKQGHVKRQEQALRCLARAGQGTTRADFNGDGIGDLAVGVPEEDLATGADAGAVNVIYGSANGLTDAGNQLLTQIFTRAGGNPSEPGDRFGSALAGGDFNGDGRADLAVGVPGEDLATAADAGMVMVFYGSATGLTHISPSGAVDVWTQATVGVPGDPQAGDQFGFALTWGDFGRGAQGDLAVGVPGETIFAGGAFRAGAGAVDVIYGTATGLNGTGSQGFSQASILAANPNIADNAESGDRFGASLSAGNLGRDPAPGQPVDDLAVGAPLEDVGAISDAGAVDVLYAPSLGGGLSPSGAQFVHQNTPVVGDAAETGDQFGAALAARGDGQSGDLVIGVPFENIPQGNVNFLDAGAVHRLGAGGTGVALGSDRVFTQGSPGCTGTCPEGDNSLADTPQQGDRFGSALAIGDFGDGVGTDLAIGAPFEDLPAGNLNLADAGAVHVLYRAAGGLGGASDQFFTQDTGTLLEEAGPGDQFGAALSAWNFGRTAQAELAIGAPFDDIGAAIDPLPNEVDVGVVNVLYGGNPTRLSDIGNQLWHQGVGTIADDPERGDHFGRVEY